MRSCRQCWASTYAAGSRMRSAMSTCHAPGMTFRASPDFRPVPSGERVRYLFGPAHWRFFERKHLGPHRIIARATKVCEAFSVE